MFPWDRFGNSFVLKGLKALLEARPGSWLLFRVRFGISFFFEVLVLTAFVGLAPIEMPHSLVGRLSDFRYPTPGYKKSPGSRRFGTDILEPPDGDGLRSGQRPHISRSEGRGQSLRCQLCFRRALSSSILPFKKVQTKFT